MADKLADILRRLSMGESLLQICADQADFDYPAAPTVRLWVLNDTPPGFAAHYARARELQYEAWSDQIIEAADRPLIGTKTKTNFDGSTETTEGDNVDRAKLKVDARKWILSKLAPKKYGDRVQTEITGADGGPLTVSWLPAPPKA